MKLLIFIFLLAIFVIANDARGRRGGGRSSGGTGRGGGRSSGGTGGSGRSGSGGSYSGSSRYSAWTSRVQISNTIRYSSVRYSTTSSAIVMSYILMSQWQWSRFHIHNRRDYDSIAVCYNEIGHYYQLNNSLSPWYVCPWTNNPQETYCCGDSLSQYCCKNLDRNSVRVGIAFGVIFIVGLIILAIICGWKRGFRGCPPCLQGSTRPPVSVVNMAVIADARLPPHISKDDGSGQPLPPPPPYPLDYSATLMPAPPGDPSPYQ